MTDNSSETMSPNGDNAAGGGDDNAGIGAGDNWRDRVPADYRRVAEKFNSPSDVVQSYAQLERKLGSAVNVPGDDAAPEEREQFYNRLGRPETAEAYEIDLPGGMAEGYQPDQAANERQGRFLAEAHRMGLTQDQAQAAVNWYYGELSSELTRSNDGIRDGAAGADADLRTEWGSDYATNVEHGRRALAAFGDTETLDRMEDVLGAAPVLRMMAKIGRNLGEAGTMTGKVSDVQREELEKELDGLMKEKNYWSSERTQKRVRQIHQELHTTKPVVGAAGRRY